MLSTLPITEATKILAFEQSSQVTSSQECTTLEIVIVPDPQHSVGKSRQQRIIPFFRKELKGG
jgi:hypothetical protein